MNVHIKLEKSVAKAEAVVTASQKRKTRAALLEIMHPRWSPFDDYRIMDLKAKGNHFSAISGLMGRPSIAIEQRWQRLRVVSNIMDKLEAFGLSRTLYSMGNA